MKHLAALAGALWAALPVAAQPLDDATCGVIGEYALDLAYDAGAPAVLTPQGTTGADETGCFMTDLLISTDGRTGVLINALKWSGDGLEDWVAGHGLPISLNVSFEGAHFYNSLPDLPAVAWALNVKNRRQAVSGVLNARWDPKVQRLSIDRLELSNRQNALALSGVLSGIPPEPSQATLEDLILLALDMRIDMAGGFEALVLMPLVAGLLPADVAPAEAFADLIEDVRSYLVNLPEPQFDAATTSALNRFLSSLPSPTGRLSINIDAPDGMKPARVIRFGRRGVENTPMHLKIMVHRMMGPATLRADWHPEDSQ